MPDTAPAPDDAFDSQHHDSDADGRWSRFEHADFDPARHHVGAEQQKARRRR